MLNVAIVGAGTMGRVHSSGYVNIPDVKVVAVCDLRPEKGGEIAERHNSKYYCNFDEMLKKEKIDVVDICLPTYLHKEFALKAMKQKKHVFCEKPIALNVKDAEEMVAFSEKMGVSFSVGHVVRFFPAYKNAVSTVRNGSIGVPKLIRTTRTGEFPSWSWNNWYADYSLSGGPILDLIIHDFDWIVKSFGNVKSVYAKSFNGKVNRKEHCLVTLRLENGAIAHVEGSWAYPDGAAFGTTFEVIGTKGQIEFDSRDRSPIKKHIQHEDGVKVSAESPLSYWDEPYTAEIVEFMNSIKENRKPAVTGYEAINSLKVSLAAIESSKTGNLVELGGER